MKTALKVVTLCFLPLCLLAIWQLGSTSGRWSSYILPSPMEVYSALLTLLTSKELQEHIWISLQRVIFGFLLACGAALPLSLMLGMSHRARILLQPVLEFFRHIPPLGLITSHNPLVWHRRKIQTRRSIYGYLLPHLC